MADSTAAEPTHWTGYLAARDYVDEVIADVGSVVAVHDRLVFAEGPPRPAPWAQNIWFEPLRIAIGSIGDGAKALRAIQRNWALYPIDLHRRARLIEAQLPPLRAKRLPFPSDVPKAPLGSWTLLDANTIIAAPRCSSPFPHGEIEFEENKTTPPNRAYVKLWEALTLIGLRPAPGELCLDLGACPGGWTWALHETGARVIAVDKAALEPKIASLPRVSIRQQSAFALEPAEVGPVDWLCSDVVCYPERLLSLVRRWLDSGLARRFICTIKFQGATDHAAARAFAAIPGSRLLHLHHNKHELTWIKV